MNENASFQECLQQAFTPDLRGVVGVVDALLALCQEQELQFAWHANRCRVTRFGSEQPPLIDIPLSKSVFRAILARLAVLCNEHVPASVSPYGGRGKLFVGANPSSEVLVEFVNTPDEQKLELAPLVKQRSCEVPCSSVPDSQLGAPAANALTH